MVVSRDRESVGHVLHPEGLQCKVRCGENGDEDLLSSLVYSPSLYVQCAHIPQHLVSVVVVVVVVVCVVDCIMTSQYSIV